MKIEVPTTPWTKEQLEKTLNLAIAVELFTIPVYLSAASSIKKEHRQIKDIPVTIKDGSLITPSGEKTVVKTEMFSAYNVILSVAVQEMFHFTLACNLCNALGFRPNIVTPDLDNPPNCLTGIIGMPVKGNLTELIDTMVAIEKPDQQYVEPPSDPDQPVGPTDYKEQYKSIGDMYHALAYGVNQFWDDLSHPDNDAFQKTNFQNKYANINQVIKTKEDALIAMACITEQGEGIGLGKFMAPDYIPTPAGAMFHDLDEVDHWHRFLDIQKYLKNNTIPQHQPILGGTTTAAEEAAAETLERNYSLLIQQMHYNFRSTNAVDLRGMQQTMTYSTEVWENGGIPQWTTTLPKPWPLVFNPHSCQGLNMCKGQGYGNTGTGAGDGACATANTHGCTTTNECAGQGGCGFPGKDKPGGTDQWTPRENTCKGLGGCMSPISPDQYFPLKTPANSNQGKNVWAVARELFEAKHGPLKPVGEITSRRKAVTPTSPKGT